MASIYESKGEQVALTGPSRSAGFDPVQTFDPTREMLRAADWQAGANRRDIEALTGFSDTLNKFMIDKVKEYNENQLNLGIADILNGDLTVQPSLMEEYQKQKQILGQAADAEVAASDQLTKANPGAGETYRQQNPVIRGWRAYGQAVGKTQLAASQAEGVLGTFLRDRNERVTINLPNGQIHSFVPADAQTQPEVMAAWSMGLQKFMGQAGIADINPAILVEHLTPTMMKVRAKVIGERMDEIIRNRQAGEQEELDIGIGQNLEGLGNAETGQQVLGAFLTQARQTFNGNWAQANKFVNDRVLSKVEALGKANPQKAAKILETYSNLLINPDRPGLGTVYNRYAEEIEATRKNLSGEVREKAAEEDKAVGEEIDNIVNVWRSATETGNLSQSQRAFDAAEQELTKLAPRYPKATEELSRLRQIGRNYNALQEKTVEQAVATKVIKSRSELQILAANKYITNETANRLGEQLPEDDSAKAVQSLRPRMEAFIRNQLRGKLQAEGVNFESFKDQTLPLVSSLTDELMELGVERMMELKAAGKTTGTAQLQTYLEKQAYDALKTERFQLKKNASGQLVLPTPGKGLPAVKPYASGPSGRDYSRQIIDRLPKVVSAKRDTLLDSEKVQANIDALNNGGQPSPDLVTVAKAAGLPVRTVLQQQAQKYGITYTPAAADVTAKKYEENRRLDPTAASILANPRTTAEQRIRATARLSEARRRQQAQTQASSKNFGAGDYGGLAALTSSGEGGFNSVNYGNTQSGTQINLTSMSIGEVEKLQKQGKVFAVGFAQWIPGNLGLARSAAGLSPTEKMTPDNQLKMFWSYILNSNKRPILRDYLLGKNNDLLNAHREMAREWAAVKGPEGYGYYDNDKAGNMASIDNGRIQQALRNARKQLMGAR